MGRQFCEVGGVQSPNVPRPAPRPFCRQSARGFSQHVRIPYAILCAACLRRCVEAVAPAGSAMPGLPEASMIGTGLFDFIGPCPLLISEFRKGRPHARCLELSKPIRADVGDAARGMNVRRRRSVWGRAARDSAPAIRRRSDTGPARGISRVVASRRSAARSILYSHGRTICTWPHWRTPCPTPGPGFQHDRPGPRSRTCAAAARPTGPAPTMATLGFAQDVSPINLEISEIQGRKEIMPPSLCLALGALGAAFRATRKSTRPRSHRNWMTNQSGCVPHLIDQAKLH